MSQDGKAFLTVVFGFSILMVTFGLVYLLVCLGNSYSQPKRMTIEIPGLLKEKK